MFNSFNVASANPTIDCQRQLPQVLIRPKFNRVDSEANGLVKYFENRPPKFGTIQPLFNSKDEYGHRFSIGECNSAFTKATPKSWPDKEPLKDLDNFSETKQIEEVKIEKLELRYTKRDKPPTQLHFNNPTDTFATRCDVIYKTLLRDCRKYFTECFQMKSMRKAKKLSKLGTILESFVETYFTVHSQPVKREILFYLGCLVYPKEMITSRVGLYDENGKILKGTERAKKVKKIRELHNFLYNFSMEKCEMFFENPYLCIIFRAYINGSPTRIETNSTMSKNSRVYRGAIDLLNVKIDNTLSKSNSF